MASGNRVDRSTMDEMMIETINEQDFENEFGQGQSEGPSSNANGKTDAETITAESASDDSSSSNSVNDTNSANTADKPTSNPSSSTHKSRRVRDYMEAAQPVYTFTDIVSAYDRSTPMSLAKLPLEIRWMIFDRVTTKRPFWHCARLHCTDTLYENRVLGRAYPISMPQPDRNLKLVCKDWEREILAMRGLEKNQNGNVVAKTTEDGTAMMVKKARLNISVCCYDCADALFRMYPPLRTRDCIGVLVVRTWEPPSFFRNEAAVLALRDNVRGRLQTGFPWAKEVVCKGLKMPGEFDDEEPEHWPNAFWCVKGVVGDEALEEMLGELEMRGWKE